MKRTERQLSAAEAALWSRLAGTVTPLAGRRHPKGGTTRDAQEATTARAIRFPPPIPLPQTLRGPSAPKPLGHTLDASWDRQLARGTAHPDFTIDLHGCSLDAAHARLDHGLTLALSQGARLVLLVTGRPRGPAEAGGRGERRGAIRAKVMDWLAAGSHAGRIAAVRPAHPRHGGAGAVYLVLRRAR